MNFFPLSLEFYSKAKVCFGHHSLFTLKKKKKPIQPSRVLNAIAHIMIHLFLQWFAGVLNFKSVISKLGDL